MHEPKKSLKQREQLEGYLNEQLRERRTKETGDGTGKRGRKGMEYDRFSTEHESEDPVAPI
jgi:hypothetical protein